MDLIGEAIAAKYSIQKSPADIQHMTKQKISLEYCHPGVDSSSFIQSNSHSSPRKWSVPRPDILQSTPPPTIPKHRRCCASINQRDTMLHTTIPKVTTTCRRQQRLMMQKYCSYRYFPSLLRLSFVAAILSSLSIKPVMLVDASSAAGTETLVAIVGKDFVLIGADSSMNSNIAVTASNLDKIAVLVEPFPYNDKRTSRQRSSQHPLYQQFQQTIVAAAVGNSADSDRLIGILQSQAAIKEYSASVGCDVEYVNLMHVDGDGDGDVVNMDNDNIDPILDYQPGMTVESMAHFARGHISNSLRSNKRKNVCLLIAGMQPVNVCANVNTNNNIPVQQQRIQMDDHDDSRSTSSTLHSEKLQQQIKQATWGIKKKATIEEKEEEVALSSPENEHQQQLPSVSTSSTRKQVQQQQIHKLEPRLYWLDEYGSLQQIQYGSHGYGSNFILSMLDQGYKPNMSKEDATQLLLNCFQQLRTRYIINSPQPPCIKCIDSNGCILLRSDK